MSTIGIIGAMDQEISLLKAKMDIISAKNIVGIDFYMGKLCEKTVVLLRCGIGKVNAAVCTQALIDMYGVDYIINTGVAGAVSKDMNIGDIVISNDLVMHDFNLAQIAPTYGVPDKSYKADEKLIEIAKEAGREMEADRVTVHVGRIATGDQFINELAVKNKIWAEHKALCVEMEGAAIAQACHLNKIPFVVVRSISDKADEDAGSSFKDFVAVAAKHSGEMIERVIKKL